MPNSFLSTSTSILFAISAPIIAPIIPAIQIIIAVFFCIFLFFALIIVVIAHVGMKNIKFAPCAICCSIPEIEVNKNIKIVPPPHSHTTYET